MYDLDYIKTLLTKHTVDGLTSARLILHSQYQYADFHMLKTKGYAHFMEMMEYDEPTKNH